MRQESVNSRLERCCTVYWLQVFYCQHLAATGFAPTWAAQGSPNAAVVAEMMSHPYFAMQPPKTTGRELFGKAYAQQWMERMSRQGLSDADIVATFTAFTAHSIAQSYRDFVLPATPATEVIVSGGGAHNRTLLAMIAELLPGLTVTTSDAMGISSDAKEAVAFAVFANNFLFGIPNNLPSATGAPVQTIMGKLALPG